MNDPAQAIRELAAELVAAWNASDSRAFAERFAEDADFVDVLGHHTHGRAGIEAGHRAIFDTIYKGSRNTYEVERVRFIDPRAAVAFMTARLVFLADGEEMELHARPTMILERRGETWQVVAFQNTMLADDAAARNALEQWGQQQESCPALTGQ